MLDTTMATPRTRKPPTKAPRSPGRAGVKPTRADGRPKSLLTLAAEAAALDARRELLMKTLDACGWNLSKTAEELKMPGASQVIRAIRDAGLEPEYEAAKARGDVRPGARAE